MTFRSPRLKRPNVDPALAGRVPPGQHVTERWPVLQYGAVPELELASWDLRIFGVVGRQLTLTWQEFEAFPQTEVVADMHCVTRWTRLDMTWQGVPFSEITRLVSPAPEASHVLLHGEAGYAANLQLNDMLEADVLLATHVNGERLTPEHGYPLRAVIPRRYAWKSVKWLRGIEFLTADAPGFWERYGYSNEADPWQEQRFA